MHYRAGMPSLSDDLAATNAPLEYWFVKVHAGELAFLVDYIARRPTGRAEVRVSLWVRGRGRVARLDTPSWRTGGPHIAVGDCVLGPSRCEGGVEDVRWELAYDGGSARAAPAVPLLSRLHPFDLELVSRPRARFDGRVTVAGETFEVAAAAGSVTHYWGRRLPDRWRWISANSFGGTDLTLESVMLSSRLWGVRPAAPVGYLWTSEAGREQLLVSPLTGIITIAGTPHDYTVTARRPGGTVRLQCTADADRYNDLGEGIHQTLLGTCRIQRRGRDLVDTRAGLEHRAVS
jgi:hypothetical protein